MVEENETFSDMEMDGPPKLTFEELRQQVLLDLKMAPKRTELLKTLYYYSKDTKKHSRIIKVLFWALIVPLLQDTDNNKALLFGLRTLNRLISNESSHEHIIGVGKPQKLSKNQQVMKMLKLQENMPEEDEKQEQNSKQVPSEHLDQSSQEDQIESKFIARMNEKIETKQNPLRILKKIIQSTNSTQIMIESTKAVKNLAKNKSVIDMLMNNSIDLLKIFKEKFNSADTLSQEYLLETISIACEYQNYTKVFVEDEEFMFTLMQQVQSISISVVYYVLKIFRQLAKQEENLVLLQGKNDSKLSKTLISTYRCMDTKMSKDKKEEQLQTRENNQNQQTYLGADISGQRTVNTNSQEKESGKN